MPFLKLSPAPTREEQKSYVWLSWFGKLVDLINNILPSVGTDVGDNSATLTVGTSAKTQVYNTALTGNKTVMLSTTKAHNGARFLIVRTVAATGAFTINVGGLKTLNAGEWCEVEFNDSAWFLVRSGVVANSSSLTTPYYWRGPDGTILVEIEADGTLVFHDSATVWKDIKFPMAPPKTTGVGNPSLVTYNGNMRGYVFSVNDTHDFDAQEIDHDAKIDSTATIHVHWLSRSNDGTDRAVKWEVEYAVEPENGVLPSPTVASVEVVIPAGTDVNTVQRDNITTFVIPAIARLAYMRIKRIASAVAAPSVDPILSAVHFHYEIDTLGSRGITTK